MLQEITKKSIMVYTVCRIIDQEIIMDEEIKIYSESQPRKECKVCKHNLVCKDSIKFNHDDNCQFYEPNHDIANKEVEKNTRRERVDNVVRFSSGGKSIDGYYAIYDAKDEDGTIWIDCKEEFIPVIVNALNEKYIVSC